MEENKPPVWTEEYHQEFYNHLKNLSIEDCSRALIDQSKKLISEAKGQDPDLLKAAESIMGYWLMQVNHDEDRFQANQVLCRIYEAMGEPEKAKNFGQ